ncbi:unnamed protein product [Phytomonas sp. EM1]|nr:unnamed protein product [Phytomonas sp. EM1]|eukprot:CCW65154.1 unnamed protein product [Phytomonas sp. isolate EM1]
MYALAVPQLHTEPTTVFYNPLATAMNGAAPYLGHGTPAMGLGFGPTTSTIGLGFGQGTPAIGLGAGHGAVAKEVVCLPPTMGLVDGPLHVILPVYGPRMPESVAPPPANPMLAMPLMPPPMTGLEKRLNGLNYIPGGLYEGYVKRYNPVRGFGFLTATHQIFPAPDTLPNASTTTAKDFERSATDAPDGNGISPDSSPEISFTPYEADPGAAVDARPADILPTPRIDGDVFLQLEPMAQSYFEGMLPDASLTSFASAMSATSTAMKSGRSYTRVPTAPGDIFVHQSYVRMHGFRTLPVGGRVRFQVSFMKGHCSFQAVSVELLPQVVPSSVDFMNTSTTENPDSKKDFSANWVDELK